MSGIILPDGIGPHSGLLCDRQIKDCISKGYLLNPESADFSKIKYVTYEIRVSNDYHKVIHSEGRPTFSAESVEDNESIVIEPGQTIKVLAKEVFQIPNNVYAKINTVGQIFSAGLAAENTFADPGFYGQIYITLSNISSRRLSLRPNDPLARVEFHKLEEPVETPHAGQTGIRKNFVRVESDGDIRELLSNKSIEELISEMVSRSVDEALQARYERSEILIQKAHVEIGQLKELRIAVRRLRWLGTGVFFLFALTFAYGLNVAAFLPLNSIVAWLGNLTISFLAAYIFFLVQRKFLS